MAAGIATLEVLASERLIERAAWAGERLQQAFAAMLPRYEFLREVRGKGLMIGVELGPPRSLKLKLSWHGIEAPRKGLFCQLVTIPLFRDHKILCQVAAHETHTIKLLPSLVLSDADCDWIARGFETVLGESEQVPGAIWSLGKTLVGHAVRADA
jgi:ornithine--oxo-acid transaminase